ncbi:YaiI/YqxD family protein [Herbaspirillum sp.]|uniref:YaiI/YqxD family protein n=1 Tax=Herbaspirillum sp. TaxID=1890675 RepID=UPI0031D4E8E1
MQIWVDADACPGVIKDMLFRVADRTGIVVTLVANRGLRTPPSRHIKSIVVPAGFDVADREIVKLAQAGDLVVTADIPLAAEVVAKGGAALNPRGELYTADNIRHHLSMRNFMEELRSSGMETGGPPAFSQSDGRAFARELDRYVQKSQAGR